MRLRDLLRETPIPQEEEAARRTLAVLRAAFAAREPVSRRAAYLKPALALVAALAVVAAVLSPPGRAVLGSLRDRVAGEKRVATELFSLPASGRLIVSSTTGAWVVQANGSRRRLGDYQAAAWSPFGLFVVATRPNEVEAVDPESGDVHWTLPRPRVRFARWGGSHVDTRVAYLSGSRLHVVVGNGHGDVDLCGEPAAAPVAPAWRPGLPHTLAYATTTGRVYVVETDGCSVPWRSAPFPHPRALHWSEDGRRLLLVTSDKLVVFSDTSKAPLAVRWMRGVSDAAFAPHSRRIAVVRAGEVLMLDADRLKAAPRRFFRLTGRIGQIAWSPNARWLLVTWPAADQFLFVRSTGRSPRRIRAFAGIARQFGGGPFPRIGGWCCASS